MVSAIGRNHADRRCSVRITTDACGPHVSTLENEPPMKRILHSRTGLLLGVGVVALVIAVALILASVLGSSDESSASSTTTTAGSTTAPAARAPGAAATIALFKGIPQRLNQLGKVDAPVTMVEFADLQCPYCRDYTVTALPAIVREYVRSGKVKLVFSGMEFIGPDSDKALRAVYAAGLQGRMWNYLDLLYRSQGAENSGWVTDAMLRQIGESIPGLDTERMMADRSSAEVESALAASQQQASTAHVNQTPTFFAGPTGGQLRQIQVTSLTPDAFRPTLDALTT
jgi:protein-disulfide isomerase